MKTESEECVETSTITLQMTKAIPMAHSHEMTTTLATAGKQTQADQGESVYNVQSVCVSRIDACFSGKLKVYFPDVDLLMRKLLMD